MSINSMKKGDYMSDNKEKKGNWFMRHKIITGIIILVVVIGVVSSGGSSQSTSSNSGSGSPAAQEQQAITYEKTDTKVIIEAFDNNQLAAEKQYKDKYVEITAQIKNISEDIVGTSFLSLEPVNAGDFYVGTTIKCSFKNSDDLLSVKNGEKVTLKGKVKEQSLGIISIDECQIAE
jgi:hypothetical protein